MNTKQIFFTAAGILMISAFACTKEKNSTAANSSAASLQATNAIAAACADFRYPDTILYPSEYPAGYEIPTVKRLLGTFGAYPDGLNIDEDNGDIEISESETGLKYLVWFVARGTMDTCKIFVTVSGINYPDSIYTLKNNPSFATPVYNASLQQTTVCNGSCEFDDGHDDDNGNGFTDEPPAGQEVIPQGVAMDKATGSISLKQTIANGALGTGVSGSFKDYILNYRISDRSGKKLNKTTLRMYYFKNQSLIPARLKRDLAEKKKMVIDSRITNPYDVPYYEVKKSGSGSGSGLVQKERGEVKCRPPYIIIVQN